MMIVVEGPDGAGKSTLVSALDRALWKAGRGCVLTCHKASPRRPALEEYAHDLAFYRPGSDLDLVLDRSWVSEDVYGPLWRGQPLPPFVRLYLDAWAQARGAVWVVLDAPDHELVRRVTEHRGDDLVTEAEEVRVLASLYRELQPTPSAAWNRVTTVDEGGWTEAIIEMAARADDITAGLRDHPTYVGHPRPSTLFLGDKRSDRVADAGYASAFPPTPGSAAQQVLWPALADLATSRTVGDWGLANAGEEDVAALWNALGRPKVVALGMNAGAVTRAAGVPLDGSAPHPQYVKRFFYSRRHEYRDLLVRAAAGAHLSSHFGPTDTKETHSA